MTGARRVGHAAEVLTPRRSPVVGRVLTRRSRGRGRWTSLAALAATLACAGDGHSILDPQSGDPAHFRWNLPVGFVAPAAPSDNPMSNAKVELGRRLFYDTRLSVNGAFSCASCHRQADAFADAKNVPVGTTGQAHTRNSMALANVAYQQTLGWAGPNTKSLEEQALIPMFGDRPVELGLKDTEVDLIARIRRVSLYQTLFPKSFPNEAVPFTVRNITRALAAFQRTLITGNAPYDRFVRGDRAAISASAQRGEALFFSLRLACASCHPPPLFTVAASAAAGGAPGASRAFFNTGLYNVGSTGNYPIPNRGLFETTGVSSDMGRMKVPSLRNVSLTFPYMHDGSVGSLENAIDNYARGGRLLASGPNAGDGQQNPFKDGRIRGFTLSAAERGDLVAFLHSLTDSSFVKNPAFSNPWR